MKNTFSPLCNTIDRYYPEIPKLENSEEVFNLWHYFSKQLGWGNSIHSKATFNFLINAKEFSKNGVVLDAGAGHQRYKPFFHQSIYLSQEHPSGIDFKKMHEITYDIISAIDEKIPLINESITSILSTSVLEHVRYPERFMLEAYRILKPGGRLYIHVPFAYVEHEVPFDFQRPTKYGLQAWLKDSGFNKVSVLPSSNNFYGATAFTLESMRKELEERGYLNKFNDVAPILKYLIDLGNSATDDYINLNSNIPIGWIAIAEKDGKLPSQFKYESKENLLQKIQISSFKS